MVEHQVAIHSLRELSVYPEANYTTDGCQQQFFRTPGACLAYQPLISFLAYTSDTGRISLIEDRFDPITSLIPEHFHQHLFSHQDSSLHITPYNLVSRIPRPDSDSKPAFIQCGRHSKFGSIFGLSLRDPPPYSKTYCNNVPHYINE